MPNGATIDSSHRGLLPLPAPIAMPAHVLPELSHSLISIGKLCDAGCTATFDAKKVVITHNQDEILTGKRNTQGLWMLPTTHPTTSTQVPRFDNRPQAHFSIHDAMIPDIVKFLHLTLYSPTKSTLLAAIRNNHFVGWPGLTERNVQRYLTLQEPTIMGHMDQQRQGTRSTQRMASTPAIPMQPTTDQPDTDDAMSEEVLMTRTHHAYLSVQDLPTGRVFTDQTGPFPVVSTQGIKAVMVMYDYDSNAILLEGITSRGKTELLRAYTVLLQRLQHAGMHPRIQRMDNEVSDIFKNFLQTQNIALELTPAHVHRRNAAERAIRTWKNHFLAGLASLNPRFPIRFWAYLLPQSEITLNLLRKSRINPKLSAYAQLLGHFDFNKTPMAPPGCELIAFVPPAQRPSWGYHGQKAWYTRPAMQHYRCVHAINASTGRETTVETMQFLPHNFRVPSMTPIQLATATAQKLIEILRQPTKAFTSRPNEVEALSKLADIFATMSQRADLETLPRVPPETGPQTISPAPPRVLPPNPTSQDNPQAGHAQHLTVSQRALADTILQEDIPAQNHYAGTVFDEESGRLLEYRQLIKHPKLGHIWKHAAANEFGRLAQGIRDIKGTNTIRFIPKAQMPNHKRATYARFVADIRPQKAEKHRVRMTIGGNLIEYEGDVSSPTGGLTTYKLHCNDIISTPGARCMNIDIENYYLNTPLPSPEYMRVHISLIPDEIIQHYNLRDIMDTDGSVFLELLNGMYGLPQAGILAYQLLVQRLAPYGYAPVRHTPGYWTHPTKQTRFVLVVDDFSIKYTNRADVEEFLSTLRQWYTIKEDWDAKLYCGIHTEWDYTNRKVTLSMPGYIDTFLKEINHPLPRKEQHAPHPYIPVQYGVTTQYAEGPDNSEPLPKSDAIQPAKIIGKLLYYARAVDSTLNVALSALAAEQNKPTMRTKKKLLQLLDYCATHPNAKLPFHASDMILYVHSDAGYNNEPGARSRAGGHFYLGNHTTRPPLHNGAILNPTHIIKHVATSAADAEIGAAFINCKEAIPIRITLTEI